MDYVFYRDIVGPHAFRDLRPPLEAVAGALDTSAAWSYSSDLLISVHNFGAGMFILNSLRIRESLGHVPASEHVLRNMLRFAASSTNKKLESLPPDFDAQLKAMGYV